MIEPIQKASEEFQKLSKNNFDATVRSYSELNKGFQAIAAKMTDYSKQAFEDATRAFEQLAGAKSLEHVFEIQSQYAKKAYDSWVAEASKLGEMYVAVARDAYKPVEKVVAKTAVVAISTQSDGGATEFASHPRRSPTSETSRP